MISREKDYLAIWTIQFEQGVKDLQQNELANARLQFERANKIEDLFPTVTDEDKRKKARCHYLLGTVYLKQEMDDSYINLSLFAPARDEFRKSIELLNEIADKNEGDYLAFANNESALGTLYLHNEDWENAVAVNKEALKHLQRLEEIPKRELAEIYRISGEAYWYLDDWPKACENFNLSVFHWKDVNESLKNDDLRNWAKCYHYAGIYHQAQNDLDEARAFFLAEIATVQQVKLITAEDLQTITSAYIELMLLIPANDPEHELFYFASLVFVSKFLNPVPTFESLNGILYQFKNSPNWQTSSTHESLSMLLTLICNTCRLDIFPESPLKTYLNEDSNLDKLKLKRQELDEIKSNSLETLVYDLQNRLNRLEKENKKLRETVEKMQNKDVIVEVKCQTPSPVRITTVQTLFSVDSKPGQGKNREDATSVILDNRR